MSNDTELDELIHLADLDGLVRLIDRRTADRDWEGLDRVRRRCIAATRETGRQLWPAATLAEYRLALVGPPEWVATVIDGESGRFALGPLSEVAAMHHTWAELAPVLAPVPNATVIAFERGIRGELIDPDSLHDFPEVFDIPASLQAWEPAYPLSIYRDSDASFPLPSQPTDVVATPRPIRNGSDTTQRNDDAGPRDESVSTDAVADPTPDTVVEDVETADAVKLLFQGWAEGGGWHKMICVEGSPELGLAAIGVPPVELVPISAAEALADFAYAGASGGSHGRRRGMASGRYSMWWLLAAIGDLDWPPANDAITELLAELDWYRYRWDGVAPGAPFLLEVALHNRVENVSWVFNAGNED